MLLCNYETEYFLDSITTVSGRRYNILPPDTGVEPLVGRNISRDDVAGFYRTFTLNEIHTSILKLVNQYTILEFDAIKSILGFKFKECKKRLEKCILTGLIYENRIRTEDAEYFWYMVDTGGVYALDDMNMRAEHNHLPFTTGLDQKYKLYVKSQFLFDNSDLYTARTNTQVDDKKGKSYEIVHLEDVNWQWMNEYDNTIFIVNLDILEKLQVNDLILGLARELNKKNNNFYDMAGKNFLQIRC